MPNDERMAARKENPMSLIVTTFSRDARTGEIALDPLDHAAYIVGPEVWRNDVWGSEAAQRRGAILLSRLKSEDLYVDVEHAQLSAFHAECKSLLDQAPLFAADVGIRESALVALLQNIIETTVKAMATHRGIYVG
jgi:hypothetical protein